MQKILTVIVTTLFFSACTQINSNSEKAITKGGDTIADMDVSLSKFDAIEELAAIEDPKENKITFKASGIEPGWFAEFYTNKLRLVVEYGQDSVILNQEFSDLQNQKGFTFTKSVKFHNQQTNLKISIDNKPCVNPGSGNKEERVVTVELNKKNYKGCGYFIK
jgi:uncharacterized membrane protein